MTTENLTAEPSEFEEVIPDTYMREGEAIGGADSDNPQGVSVSSLKFKGYVRVWDTQTGVESLQPWWLLWQTMRKQHEDGTPVFTRTNPNIAPNYGADLFCPLNPSSPQYETFSGMGFKNCRKRHIPTQDAMYQHTRKSHKRAWESMQQQREDKIREEDRDLQRQAIATQQAFMERMMESQLPQTAPAVGQEDILNEVVEVLEVVEAVEAPAEKQQYQVACSMCEQVFERGSKGFAKRDLNRHMKKVHGQS